MNQKEKTDLRNLTFCIPVRVDSANRKRNLYSVLKFYSLNTHSHYIILEADKQCHLQDLPFSDEQSYKFVKDDNLIFHRTHYINQMLAKVKTPFAAIWDTDAIVPILQLSKAYDLLSEEKDTLIYPYDGYFWNINNFFSTIFSQKLNIHIFKSHLMERRLIYSSHARGGGFLVNVNLYKECGWENEFFRGWGPEDEERYKRLVILGRTPKRISGEMYHLFHPRGYNSRDYDDKTAYQTKREYCKICNMLPTDLKQYIKTWKWIK